MRYLTNMLLISLGAVLASPVMALTLLTRRSGRGLVLEWTALNGWWIYAHTSRRKLGRELTSAAQEALENSAPPPGVLTRSLVLDAIWLERFAGMVKKYAPASYVPVLLQVTLWKRRAKKIAGDDWAYLEEQLRHTLQKWPL